MITSKIFLSVLSILLCISLVIFISILSPERPPEPMVKDNTIPETIESVRHIYGRTWLDDNQNNLTLTVNLNYLNRWRLQNLPFEIPPQHTRSVILGPKTKIIPYTAEYAAYFPLNTFPYRHQDYPAIYDLLESIPSTELIPSDSDWLDSDQGLTIISDRSPYFDTEPLVARAIIVRDKDFQDYRAIIVPMLYPLLIVFISIPFGLWSPTSIPLGMIVRFSLVILLIGWYGVTSFL